jgi:hypothetical protein
MATLLSDEIGPLRELLERDKARIWADPWGPARPYFDLQPGEEWRRYSPDVFVSSLGRVARRRDLVDQFEEPNGWDEKRHRGRKPTYMRAGSLKVHVAVASLFIGPRPSGLLVLHNNGDFRDNRVVNLRYGTAKDNYEDAVRHGTRKRRAFSVGGWPLS